VVSSCEHGNETLGSMSSRKFLEWLRYPVLKKIQEGLKDTTRTLVHGVSQAINQQINT
jgi:hypothetical protein